MESNLAKICRAEAGEKEDELDKVDANTLALAGVAKMLKEKTGRETFTMQELMNPAQTIEKYKRV